MTPQNLIEYIFPLILAIAAFLLNTYENKNRLEYNDKTYRVRNLRRKIGISMMYLTAILITAGIYRLQHNSFDFLIWILAALTLMGIMAIGLWDIISEMGKLRQNMAKECEKDYNNLMEELKKAKIRENESEKKKKTSVKNEIDVEKEKQEKKETEKKKAKKKTKKKNIDTEKN